MTTLTDGLVARGFTPVRLYLANQVGSQGQLPSGTPAVTSQLNRAFHAYAPGQPQNTPNYRHRYEMPDDGILYHPQIADELREVDYVSAAEKARVAGYFKAALGVDLAEPLTDEELDDFNFCAPPAMMAAFWTAYGPASNPVTAPPPVRVTGDNAPEPGVPAELLRRFHNTAEGPATLGMANLWMMVSPEGKPMGLGGARHLWQEYALPALHDKIQAARKAGTYDISGFPVIWVPAEEALRLFALPGSAGDGTQASLIPASEADTTPPPPPVPALPKMDPSQVAALIAFLQSQLPAPPAQS